MNRPRHRPLSATRSVTQRDRQIVPGGRARQVGILSDFFAVEKPIFRHQTHI
jgi:hypothetical protein